MSLNRRAPPPSEADLLARARALVGHSLFEIACALRAPGDPEGGLHGKGQAGALIEAALGAPITSGATHDFPDLRVELKTVPLQKNGVPRESTYVCHFALDQARSMEWPTSWARQKLHRVLLLTTSDSKTPWHERLVLGAHLWTPNEDEEAALRADFEDLVGLASQGRIDELVAARGVVMQVRPKAAHSGVRTTLLTEQGEAIATVPRGFYLRAKFVAAVLQRLGGVPDPSRRN